ncbi:MAG: hypothetical protein HFI93_06395 [Lachnospiraceae bacterium]|nr:hypothetical protein [Lachnospiraceae bacterium]
MEKELQITGKQFYDAYVLIAPGSDYGRAMWSDIASLENGMVLDHVLKPTNRILSVLHHIHFSFVINRRLQLPFQKIWRRLYAINGVPFDKDRRYCVIYTDVSAARTDLNYLEELSGKKNITLVLVMVNTMARRASLLKKKLPCFSRIFSFDEQDSLKYGFVYHPTNYSMPDMGDFREVKSDAFYVGVSKGRAGMLADIYATLTKGGAKADFCVVGVKRSERRREGIRYNEWMPYPSVLQHIRESNCIVEVMDGSQRGVTLRTMEAICYNKKLLTNNPLMKNSKYYKTGNIQVFTAPDEIDVAFVKDRSPVDYGYEGEFSPIHLLEHINRMEAGSE